MSNIAVDAARAVGFDQNVLGLTIFPTEKCNLRCVYCYETFPNIYLDDTVTLSIKKLIYNRSSDLRALSISWFGGEPLLEKERVLEISSYSNGLAKTNGFQFVSSITSNRGKSPG